MTNVSSSPSAMIRCGVLLLLAYIQISGCATAEDNLGNETASGNAEVEDLYQKGMKAYTEEDLKTSESYLSQFVEEVPDDAQVWFRLGNIFAQTGRPGRAVNAYHRALTINPKLAKAWHNLGLVRLRQAVIDFTALANSVPPNDPLHARGKEMSRAIIELIARLPETSSLEPDPE